MTHPFFASPTSWPAEPPSSLCTLRSPSGTNPNLPFPAGSATFSPDGTQVITTGRVLDCRDDQARAEFEIYACSDYARLTEERRDILADIKARGLIYG